MSVDVTDAGWEIAFVTSVADLLTISHHNLAFVVQRLNNRPGKRLNYRTPWEVLEEAGIALQM